MTLSAALTKLTLISAGFVVGTQLPHADLAPTHKEVIEILAEYDVRHIPATPGLPYYGMTDMNNRIIYIFDNQDVAFKRGTIIHELTHVAAHRRYENPDEDTVKLIEEAEYKRLFVSR